MRWVAALWLALVLGRYAEVTAAALYGRDINLFWDLRFVPDVVALLARPERLWVVAARRRSRLCCFSSCCTGFSRGRLSGSAMRMARPRERRAVGMLAVAIVALFVGQRAGADLPRTLFPAARHRRRTSRQARLMAATLGRIDDARGRVRR